VTDDAKLQVVVLDDRERQLLSGVDHQHQSVISDQRRVVRAGRFLLRLNTVLVMGSIVAATIAGASAIPTKGAWHWLAVAAGFTSAIVAGITKAFDLPQQASVKFLVYNLLAGLRDDLARLRRNIGCIAYDEADSTFRDLEARRLEIAEVERAGEDRSMRPQRGAADAEPAGPPTSK
jgi:hypothetical protein